MSTQQVSVIVPRVVASPRGAIWAADAAYVLIRGGQKLWSVLLGLGQRRASAELHRQAQACEGYDPQRAADLREAAGRHD